MPLKEDLFSEFWDKQHAGHVESALSGHSLDKHVLRLNVHINSVDRVLCIGVGMGDWIRELKADVWVLDISPIAINSIKEDVLGCYLTPKHLPTGMFDLAMSLWVAPHMTDRDLANQIYHVVRSLSPIGVFALQYCEAHGTPTADDYDTAIVGGIKRKRETILEMVEFSDAVATVAYVLPRPKYNLNEVTVHIRRK